MPIKQHSPAPGHSILYDDQCLQAPTVDMFRRQYWQAQNAITGQATGRGTTLFIERPSSDWVLRHYCRGGLIGKLLDDQYLFTGVSRTRAFQEFKLLAHMREAGLPVPQPIAAHVHRRGLIYQADLLITLIPGSQDLHQVLCQRPLSDEEWQRVGAVVAQLHNQQIYHHDLNIRNIMLDDQGQVWIIDFDRCYRKSGQGWKSRPLQRLNRSLYKEVGRNAPFHWQPQQWQTLLAGYQQQLKPA